MYGGKARVKIQVAKEHTVRSPVGAGTTKGIGGDNADYDMIGLFSCRVYMAENRQQWYIGARLKM